MIRNPISIRTLFHLYGLLCLAVLSTGCGIHPVAWHPPTKPAFEGNLNLNQELTQATHIDLQGWTGPEEFVFDSAGNMYCGVHKGGMDFGSGAILKITPAGVVETFLETENWVTGIQFDPAGNLIAMMHGVGLVKVYPNKNMEVLLEKDPAGRPIMMGTGLKIAKDGKIYFANISTTQTPSAKYLNQLFLELVPTGGLYCYDPATKKTRTLSEGNYFANGLALAEDESYLLLSETSKYRVLKYGLTGEKAGKVEIFLENMAGFPNNISRRDNGNFWIGFTTKRNDQLDQIHPKIGMKKFVYSLPGFLQPKTEKFGMIQEVTPAGEVVQTLFDPTGEAVQEAGAVTEFGNELFIGGDVVPYIARYRLPIKNQRASE